MNTTVYNFSPGPCTLPKAVYEQIGKDLTNWNGTGVSVMEMSHRNKWMDSIQQETRADLRKLMDIPEEFEILFFQGGATQQYTAVIQNLLG